MYFNQVNTHPPSQLLSLITYFRSGVSNPTPFIFCVHLHHYCEVNWFAGTWYNDSKGDGKLSGIYTKENCEGTHQSGMLSARWGHSPFTEAGDREGSEQESHLNREALTSLGSSMNSLSM